jgi:N-acetyl-gamma-glutamylphosphate reductase
VAHHDLMGDIEMNFTDTVNPNVNVVFLCLGHGKSIQFLEQNQFASHTKIIDLGNDFRLTKDKKFKGKSFVYGLPELNKANIRNAEYIANPGCLPLRYNWLYYRLQQRIIKDRCPYQCYNGKYWRRSQPIRNDISAGDQITCRITKHSTTSI